MDFGLSKEQEMLKKEARKFLEKECPEEIVREIEKGELGYSPDLWAQIADLGWLGILFPEKYGGLGSNILDLTFIYEEIGRAMFPGPFMSTVVLCGTIILSAGTEVQKQQLLPAISDGKLKLAFALTEPDAAWQDNAWDACGVTVKAVSDRSDYVINGTKLFVHDAAVSDKILCVARTNDSGDPRDGITIFLVDKAAVGVTINVLKTIAGDKQCEVIFDNVKVDKEDIIGGLNQGWPYVERAVQYGATMLCAQMIGAGEELLKIAVNHAKTRVQFDAPIGINQYVQEHCTELVADIEGCRYVTYQAAWKLSENMPAEYEVAVAKAWSSEAFERAALRAHAVLAGYGYTTKDGVIPMYSRRGKVQQLYLGNSDFWLEKVANQMDSWTYERPEGKPLGLWTSPLDEETPAWTVWTKEDLQEV